MSLLSRALWLTILPGFAVIAQQQPSISSFELGALDKSVDPCQNFYQYACGTWIAKNQVPADQARWSRFDELNDRTLGTLHTILENVADPRNQRSANDQKIGDYYASCIDEKAIEEKGIAPLKPALDRLAAISSKEELEGEIIRLHRDGDRVFFLYNVRPDAKNASREIANADQGGLGLPDRDYYLRTDAKSLETLHKYQAHIQAMLELLKIPAEKAREDAASIVKIETELAKDSLDRVARRNPDNTYHKMTAAELSALNPSFSWKTYLDGIGTGNVETINVVVPAFFKQFDSVWKDTSLAGLKQYVLWHELRDASPLLPKAFVDENFHFFGQTLTGAKEQRPRWKRCVASTDAALGEALGQKFVEVAFAGSSKTRTLQMVKEIEHEMEKDIKSLSWMSPATKDQALTKLELVTNKIGYPDHWKDYSSLKIVRGDALGNVKRAADYEVNRNLEKIGKPTDKSEWNMTPPTVNAYYSANMNNINFPAGILQLPFYDAKRDDAANYGAIGAVVGHELTHGFDDQGRRYDGKGDLREWWTATDAKEFEQRADCVANEYSGFTAVDDVKLNGRLTLGENAADNGGLRLAYMALMDSLANHTLPKIDGYTPAQRFFLGWAQVWCQNSTPESRRLRALTDPHSPGDFRVNGVLQNMPEFQQAFGCKVGQPMVSEKPCRVW